jgi:putative transposase
MIKGRPPRLNRIFSTYDAPLFFVTACTLHRAPFSSLPTAHDAFLEYARRAQSFNIAVGRYVTMPDHVHLFVCGPHDFVLAEWMKGLKRGISNAFASASAKVRWPPGLFDHMRNDEKWNYIRENPVRAGLVTGPALWPYAGEIVYIDRV